MAIKNSILNDEWNQKMSETLDKAVTQKAVTGFFEDSALRTKWMGTKTVLIPEMELSGAGDYDRATGFVQGAISLTNTPFTLTMDRGRTFIIDRMDEDEAGIAGLAGQIMGEYVRTKIVPEVDAYVLSKLAGLAVTAGQTVTGDPATQVYAMISEAINKANDAAGYGDQELVCFVNPTVYAALQSTQEVARHLVLSDFKKGNIDTKVQHLNGVAILPVSSARMKTAYTFYDGSSDGQTAGGFVPAENAKSIGLLILPKKAAHLIKKTEKTRTFSPDQNLTMDAWKLDHRIVYDVVVKNSELPNIYTYVY